MFGNQPPVKKFTIAGEEEKRGIPLTKNHPHSAPFPSFYFYFSW
jgi:hypothetical protein